MTRCRVSVVLTEPEARMAAMKLFLDGLESIPKLSRATSYPQDMVKRWRVEDQWDRRKLQRKAAEMAVDLKKFGFNPTRTQIQYFRMCKEAMNRLQRRMKATHLTDAELRGLISLMQEVYTFQKNLMNDIPQMIQQQSLIDSASQFDKVAEPSMMQVVEVEVNQ